MATESNTKTSEINEGRITIESSGSDVAITERPLIIQYILHGIPPSGMKLVILSVLGFIPFSVIKKEVPWDGEAYVLAAMGVLFMLPAVLLMFPHCKIYITPNRVTKIWKYLYFPIWFRTEKIRPGNTVKLLTSDEVRTTNVADAGMGTRMSRNYSPGFWLVSDGSWKIKPITLFDGESEAKDFYTAIQRNFLLSNQLKDTSPADNMYEKVSRSWPEGVRIMASGEIIAIPRLKADFNANIGLLIAPLTITPLAATALWLMVAKSVPEDLMTLSLLGIVGLPTVYFFMKMLLYVGVCEVLQTSGNNVIHKITLFGMPVAHVERHTNQKRVGVVSRVVKTRSLIPIFQGPDENQTFLSNGEWELKFPRYQSDDKRQEILMNLLVQKFGNSAPLC